MSTQDQDAGQYDTQGSMNQVISHMEQAPEQDEGTHAGHNQGDQVDEGLETDQLSEHEHSGLQEPGVSQPVASGTLQRGASAPVDPSMDQPDHETHGTAPDAQPEREAVSLASQG